MGVGADLTDTYHLGAGMLLARPRSTSLARAGLAPARTGLLLMVAKQPAVSAFPALTAGVATASEGSDDLEQT